MIYKMTLKDSADEMTFYLLEVPIVDKDIEGAVDNVTLDGNQYTDYLWLKKQFVQKWSILCDDEYTRLRGFYTRQFENADVPSYRLYYGDDIIRNSTLSGERIELSISGVADGTMSLTQMDGNATQTTYSGKNLFDRANAYEDMALRWAYGDTYAEQNSIAMSNYATVTAGDVISTNFRAQVMFYASDKTYLGALQGDGETIAITGGGSFYGFTVPSGYDIAFFRLGYRTSNNRNANMNTQNIMVNFGNTVEPYEPFVGGTPAPNPEFPQPISTVTGENVVKVTGKNLIDEDAMFDYLESNGFTVEDVTFDGREAFKYYKNSAGGLNIAYPVQVPSGQVTVSFKYATDSGSDFYIRFLYSDGSGSDIKRGDATTWTDVTATSTAGKTVTGIRFMNYGGSATKIYIAKGSFQLELGSTATSYQAFTAQDYEVNLGKNLCPTATVNNVTWASSSVVALKDVLNSLRAGTYSISMDFTLTERNDTTDASKYGLYLANSGGGLTDNAHEWGNSPVGTTKHYEKTITISDAQVGNYSTVYLYGCGIQGVGATGKADVTQIQIEQGQPTPYAPYFTPLELAGVGEIQPDGLPKYHDKVKKNLTTGKWYVEKQVGKVVLDGTENWSDYPQQEEGFYNAYTSSKKWGHNGGTFASTGDFTNDHFQNSGTYFFQSTQPQNLASTEYACYCHINSSIASDANAIKTWFASNPTTVYYALATPTTTQITNEALVEELEALQDEAISVGQHNIYTDTPNALPTLTFDLTEYLSQSTTIIPETAVRLTLTDGGVINACGCRKDVQLTMRETIE